MTTSAFVQDGPRLENSYASDWLLKSYLRRKLGPDLLAAIEPELLELGELGELAMGRLLELQRVDRCNEPTLTQWPRPNSRVTRCHLRQRQSYIHVEIEPTIRVWKEDSC
jgi:hypothetical protein